MTDRVAEHLSVPIRRPRGGAVQTVPQDSTEEIEQCVAAILRTRVGHRDDLPDFGTPDQAFTRGGVDLDEVERSIVLWEDRADVLVMRDTGRLAELAAGLDRVTVSVEG